MKFLGLLVVAVGLTLGQNAKAECDMGDVHGCGPLAETQKAELQKLVEEAFKLKIKAQPTFQVACDMQDVNGCGPVVMPGQELASCDMANEAGCFPVATPALELASCDMANEAGCGPVVAPEQELLGRTEQA